MNIIVLILIAISLSFDTFAVSVSCGCIESNIQFRQAARIAFFFALFQAVMPVLGWLLGSSVSLYIQAFDHWIAFGLLSLIGGKMIAESFNNKEEKAIDIFSIRVILTLSFATTIDAFIIGIVFASLKTNLFLAVPIIGIITFLAAMLGMLFGKKVESLFGKKIEIAGGIILIAIGTKILIEHLFFK
jgi:manganese efflux pump family protein